MTYVSHDISHDQLPRRAVDQPLRIPVEIDSLTRPKSYGERRK
ncbi:hypothetical protein [Aeromonas bivalvium]